MKVYPREQKKIDEFTETQLEEAMQKYTNKVQKDIRQQLEGEYGIKFDMDDMGELLVYFNRAIDLAFTQGMELAADRWKLREYYEQSKKVAINPISSYIFEADKGVSGVLFPDGEFKKCGNAQHYYLLEGIPFELQTQCLYFSCTMFDNGDGLITTSKIGFTGITLEQREWLEENFNYLDRGQKRIAWLNWDIEGEYS